MRRVTADMSSTASLRRRQWLMGALGAPLAMLGGCGGGAAQSPLTDPFATAGERRLPILPLDPGTVDAAGLRSFSLVAQRGSTQFFDRIDTSTQGYNGALLGPALRLRRGERTLVTVRNALAEPTTVHWHGLVVPAEVDGGPHQVIAPGASWAARFTVDNPTSTCWFHPHGHGATGRQVVSGLAGLLIVDDPALPAATLPQGWGVDDIALVLQDKRFTTAGQIDYVLGADEAWRGYRGERLLVNGVIGPTWLAPRQWIRLRLLNACNARTLRLRLSDSGGMLQVANEGGLLPAPLATTALVLAPAERAEVLIDLGRIALGREVWLNAASVADGMGMGGSMGMGMGGTSGDEEVPALRIRVTLPAQPGAMASPPARLPASPPVSLPAGALARNFDLDGGMMGEAFTINGRRFDLHRVDFAVPAGAVETWRFTNRTMMAHPVHVHGVHMSVLSRDGRAPAPHEVGLRDTFNVEPMQTVAVAVRTPAAASATPLMMHCHILEHEDAGMMAQFVAV